MLTARSCTHSKFLPTDKTVQRMGWQTHFHFWPCCAYFHNTRRLLALSEIWKSQTSIQQPLFVALKSFSIKRSLTSQLSLVGHGPPPTSGERWDIYLFLNPILYFIVYLCMNFFRAQVNCCLLYAPFNVYFALLMQFHWLAELRGPPQAMVCPL